MKNEIVEAIRAVGLDPSPREFDIDEDESEAWIKHKRSGALFIIAGSVVKYVGRHQFADWPAWSYEAYGWGTVMQYIRTWLGDVKRDLETPDLWAELQSEAELLRATYHEDTDNTPFTSQEKTEIAERLHEFAEYAERTYSLSEVQKSDLNEKLDYLVEATNRLGRIDWRNAVVGAILAFVLTAALPPESARDLFHMLLRVISHLHGFPELP